MKIHMGTGEGRIKVGGREEEASSVHGLIGRFIRGSPTFVPLVISDVDRPHHAYTGRIGKRRGEKRQKKTTDGVI